MSKERRFLGGLKAPSPRADNFMALLFTVGSTFSLAKTMRDRYEASKFVNRVASAKTEKILHDYEYRDVLNVGQ